MRKSSRKLSTTCSNTSRHHHAARSKTMIKRPFGWTNVEVPVIGQGTWMIEGDPDGETRAVETLCWGLDRAPPNIDAAEMYGDGRGENWVAEAIAGRRDEVFLASK